MNPIPSRPSMEVRAALQVLVDARHDDTVVLTNQGSARVWPLLAEHPLDFHYNPSTMGGVIPLGLGLALACPERTIVAISGDGSLAMNLGCLISIVASRATNLLVIVLDNGMYEVTGGQTTAARLAEVDYVSLAKSVGFPHADRFDDVTAWRQGVGELLKQPGPHLISLAVQPASADDLSTQSPSLSDQLTRLRTHLGSPGNARRSG